MNYLVLGLFVPISTLLAAFPATAEAKGNPLEGTISIESQEHRTLAQNKTIKLITTVLADYRPANQQDKAVQLGQLVEQAKARNVLSIAVELPRR